MSYEGPARGLGDTVSAITKRLRIKPCGGCEERRKMLNRFAPYKAPINATGNVRMKAVKDSSKLATATSTLGVEEQARVLVVAEARSWLGTPYLLGARLKGVGCDCATLLLEVYRACGLIRDEDMGVFSGDWWMHTTEEKYLFRVARHAHKIAETVASRSIVAGAGCLALSRVAGSRVYNHGGIVLAWPQIIHANVGGVEEINASRHPMWSGRPVVIFDPWEARR